MNLLVKTLESRIEYTGAELRAHWVSEKMGDFSSGIVAFRGGCSVATGELVDLEDQREGDFIRAKEMVHFLGEWFGMPLPEAITLQRLLIAGFAELLAEKIGEGKGRIWRKGNDLYWKSSNDESDSKLSVSIVTATPISCLFHFGVNVNAEGAPVRAIGLQELGVNIDVLVGETLSLWKLDWNSIQRARCKVLPK